VLDVAIVAVNAEQVEDWNEAASISEWI